MDDTKQLLTEQLKNAPADVRAFLTSPDFTEEIDTIAGDYELNTQEKLSLTNETILLALGLSEPDDFVDNLKNNPEIKKEAAESIFVDVMRFIISRFQEPLNEFLKKESDSEEGASAPQGSNLATIPNNQPYNGPMHSNIPVKDVNPFLPPLNKNKPEAVPRIVVPPNITVSDAFKGPAPAPTATELQNPFIATGEVVSRVPEKTTPVTSALAAELGNLLDSKPTQNPAASPQQPKPIAQNARTPVRPAVKAEPPVNLPIAAVSDMPSTIVNPPKIQTPPPVAPASMTMDKLSGMTQKPKVEVEMKKTAPAADKQSGDPYREPVE